MHIHSYTRLSVTSLEFNILNGEWQWMADRVSSRKAEGASHKALWLGQRDGGLPRLELGKRWEGVIKLPPQAFPSALSCWYLTLLASWGSVEEEAWRKLMLSGWGAAEKSYVASPQPWPAAARTKDILGAGIWLSVGAHLTQDTGSISGLPLWC